MEKILNIGRKLIPKKLFKLAQPIYHFLLALSGNIFYFFPGRRLVCIGVTGTNGKSTTVELVNSILKAGGLKTGMISTIAIEVNNIREENKTSRTTLGRWQMLKLLRKMIRAGCNYAVLEVASEGIVQSRVWGIPFDVTVFTNLSPEHLNTHKTMKNYRNAKGRLFASMSTSKRKTLLIEGGKRSIDKVSIVNAEDKEAVYFGSFPADKHYSFGFKKGNVRAVKIEQDEKVRVTIDCNGKEFFVNTFLPGEFNVKNILAAWAVGDALGIDSSKIKKGIEAVKNIKGRMEKVIEKDGVKYYIDYAMTPDSYEMLLKEMRKLATGRVFLVFGAAGERDRAKRPQIAKIAANFADFTIVTNDEPYNEDPKKIIEEIEAGFKKAEKDNYIVIPNRKKAFKEAFERARSGDVVVVPGIGHQPYRNIGKGKKIPWNEAEIIREIVGMR